MQVVDGQVVWSASDLTAAASCEYAVVRRLDVLLHGADKATVKDDPLMEHIAQLGDLHEAEVLAAYDVEVTELARAPHGAISATAAATTALLSAASPTVIAQACLYDGEFLGYADFLEPSERGWVVCDAKLARQARPKALLQLAAYADQIARLGLAVAPEAFLILGTGEREPFPLAEILPVFAERRDRLRAIIRDHRAGGVTVSWGDERYLACGSCADCAEAISATQDVWLVANLRVDQRRKLRAAGIRTVAELADAATRPEGMNEETFLNLRAQARMQRSQLESGDVSFELRDGAEKALSVLPAPSTGDLFFDFEGDPLYQEAKGQRWGLEYLWGILGAPVDGTSSDFRPLWAHNWVEERAALNQFMEYVAARRAAYPDMHIYHYAAYEVSALKRLTRVYETYEHQLDDLLRSGVFVDLYATVRGAIRVSQSSYSIKKLEPLYMAAREGEVQGGDVSIAEYHEFQTKVAAGDEAAAQARLVALADYNRDDCVSTLLLRDWLLKRAAEAGPDLAPVVIDREGERDEEHAELHAALRSHVGDGPVGERTPEQQAFAMLANALGYHRRENAPFWWGHFDRLDRVPDAWEDERDVFRVESSEVVKNWCLEGKQRNPRRTLRLIGDWGTGSTPGSQASVVYEKPTPASATVPEGGALGVTAAQAIVCDAFDTRVVLLTESCPGNGVHSEKPVALVPTSPPNAGSVKNAIAEFAGLARQGALPPRPAIDILLRRPPRMDGPGSLPTSGRVVDNVVDALTGMTNSYVAIQGPPGTGKSWTGARVIKRLVEEHGWRIGVVAQSHAVVENLLDGIVEAGLDPKRIVKSKVKSSSPEWSKVVDTKQVPPYLDKLDGRGCVVGGSAWDFTGNHIERGSLDLLVIDEAGQFALAPTIGVSMAAQRLLLLGDPQQLPQVSQGTHAEPVNESALGWLMQGHDTLPPELGYFLAESHRMHPELCARVSQLSYDGRLSSADDASQRELVGVPPGLRVVRLDHEHCRTESPEEAEEVLAQIKGLIGTSWRESSAKPPRPLAQSDFLVVAPYNAQVNLIRKALADSGMDDVLVGTVDKFQGRQAPVVLVSMTASSHGEVPRGMGFLLNRNRVNVAVSRAQWLAIVVRSRALTAFMPTTIENLLELGAFAGLCEPND